MSLSRPYEDRRCHTNLSKRSHISVGSLPNVVSRSVSTCRYTTASSAGTVKEEKKYRLGSRSFGVGYQLNIG